MLKFNRLDKSPCRNGNYMISEGVSFAFFE